MDIITEISRGLNVSSDIIRKHTDNNDYDFTVPCSLVNVDLTDLKIEHVTSMKVVNGFIQIVVDKSVVLRQVLTKIMAQGPDYGKSTMGQGRKVIVEFSSPNVAKPFHAGHLRSTVLGNFITNLYKSLGYETVS